MLKLEKIEKRYNGEPVLRGISLEVNDGEFLSIMGRSGSGKSTLLNVLGGFLLPDSGKVYWDNEDVYSFTDTKMAEMRCNKVGFVFQGFQLISTLSVLDNIMLPASLSKVDADVVEKNLKKYAAELRIDGLMEKFPEQLSGGQCQRVAICRALCFEPSLLILDEPTGALDSENEKRVMEMLRRLNKEKKLTIIQVTHSKTVAAYAGKILEMSDGLLV